MRVLQKIKRLIFGNNIDCIYFHEAGHVVIAKLFDDIFQIINVTANAQISQLYDSNSLGGLRCRPKKQSFSIFEYDILIHIMLAGLCADDINNSNGKITENIYETSIWNNKFGQNRYSGDKELIDKCWMKIKTEISIEWEDYIVSVMRNLHIILSVNEVWDSVELIKTKLKKSCSKTLTGEEINSLLNNSSFSKWKERNVLDIINIRKELIL